MSAAPVRTCVGCGQRAPQRDLLRIVAGRAGLQTDPTRRLPGRGGYLHADRACWARFVQRRGSVRSLRVTPPRVDRERLVAALQGASE